MPVGVTRLKEEEEEEEEEDDDDKEDLQLWRTCRVFHPSEKRGS